MEPFTTYDKGTLPQVRRVLEDCRRTGTRVRVWYGDYDTGRDWCEESDMIGTPARSAGRQPALILVHNARSRGGTIPLTAHIVKVMETRTHRLRYMHPAYQFPEFTTGPGDLPDRPEYRAVVYRDAFRKGGSDPWARFTSMAKARRWIAFMIGQRSTP